MTEEKLAYANELNEKIHDMESFLNKEFIGFCAYNRNDVIVEYFFSEVVTSVVLKALKDRLEELKKEFEELKKECEEL